VQALGASTNNNLWPQPRIAASRCRLGRLPPPLGCYFAWPAWP
jgi:hypothetical protein